MTEVLTPEQRIEILAAFSEFQDARINDLLKGAATEYENGLKFAADKARIEYNPDDYKDSLSSFLEHYKLQLHAGYTVIQGKVVNWLKNRSAKEQDGLFYIIEHGLQNNVSSEDLASSINDYFNSLKEQHAVIAADQMITVFNRARDYFYKDNDLEKFTWILGDDPCPICEPLGGQVFTWATMPCEQPVHPKCECGLEPTD